MSVNDQYALNWSNHTNHIKKAFDSLLAGSEFVDVTLSCEGKKITAHKMLLSACSTYFHDLFRDNPCQHPIVILKDVKFQNLVDILKFMYNGEVSVATENFDSFLKTAELLQVSGLTDDDNRYGNNEKEDEASENSRVSFVEHLPDQTSSNSTVKKSIVEKPREKETTKKRSTDINIEKSTSHKKRKESEVKPDMEIKQEGDVNFEEDNVQIRDPLEIDQHGDTMEGMELLQPVRARYIQKHRLAQTKRRDVSNRKVRRPCYHCFAKIKKMGGNQIAKRKVKKVTSYCGACPNKPFMCLDCFDDIH